MTTNMYDPETGEELPRPANGDPSTAPASNIGQLIALCEEGALDQDIARDSRKLVHALRAVAFNNGGKAKGKITITLDVEVEGELIMLRGDYVVKEPKAKRQRSAMYATEDGRITPNRPGQGTFFGHRTVAEAKPTFTTVDATATTFKDVG
jgi:hypothetical protein